jgi:hypothetical protein
MSEFNLGPETGTPIPEEERSPPELLPYDPESRRLKFLQGSVLSTYLEDNARVGTMPTIVWNMLTRLSASNLDRRQLAQARVDLTDGNVPADQQPFIFIVKAVEGRKVVQAVKSRYPYERRLLDRMAIEPNNLYRHLRDNPELRGVPRMGPQSKTLIFGFVNHLVRSLDTSKDDKE